ncbi:MAG: S1C family serine protease, partial [Planctomycetota bacterium]|nr:S1C family serine protease [Planctomycetota bacterium]
AMGSAVIVSPDGYVLCAGHVIGKPGREVTLIFPDGREVQAKTLGANFGIDSGLIKITTEGTWPYAQLGHSGSVRRGQWCLTTGHPGGYQRDRSPPVRLGRVLLNEPGAIVTDCPLVGGDSGGPLFDMQGRVIGIHSRIADDLRANLHVPVDTYRETWKRLVASEVWGGLRPGGPVIGVIHDDKVEEARIAGVLPDSPAQEAGIRAGDVITKFDGKEIKLFRELAEAVSAKEPGDRVRIELRRDERTLDLELVIGSFDL